MTATQLVYHFTAKHHLEGGVGHPGPGIEKVGLLANHHPLLSLPAGVWLTEDGSWSQPWSPRVIPGINCDRTEVRLTVEVPAHHERLIRMPVIRQFIRPNWKDDFEAGGPYPWLLFMGWIAPEWIVAIEPRQPLAAAYRDTPKGLEPE